LTIRRTEDSTPETLYVQGNVYVGNATIHGFEEKDASLSLVQFGGLAANFVVDGSQRVTNDVDVQGNLSCGALGVRDMPLNVVLVSNASGKIVGSSTTTTRLGYLNNVTSDVQTQLNNRLVLNGTSQTVAGTVTIQGDVSGNTTGAIGNLMYTNLPTNVVLTSSAAGKIGSSSTTTTTLGYLNNVTSDVQTQLNNRLLLSGATGQTVSGNVTVGNLLIQGGGLKPAVGSPLTIEGAGTSVFFASAIQPVTGTNLSIKQAGGNDVFQARLATTIGAINNAYTYFPRGIYVENENDRIPLTVNFNRGTTADNAGTLVRFKENGTDQGRINFTATSVTFSSFAGSHYSQLPEGGPSKPDIPLGTVMSSVDGLCDWVAVEWTDADGSKRHELYDGPRAPGETFSEDGVEKTVVKERNDRLTRSQPSSVPGDKRVYGVFGGWDDDDDASIVSLGAWTIRIAPGVTVQGGDLLESDGNGCARPQADDIIRSSTIGKVTSSTAQQTYADGSYLVPCVLYCG
jgi:hypothetical protein